jgi:hypothetical protein
MVPAGAFALVGLLPPLQSIISSPLQCDRDTQRETGQALIEIETDAETKI